jgi:hypothetical protein
MSKAVKNYIDQQLALQVQRNERNTREKEEEEAISAAMPRLWEELRASMEKDCIDSPRVFTFREIPGTSALQIRSAWHWHDLHVGFDVKAGSVTAQCRTNYLTSPEELLWSREYVGAYRNGAVYLTLVKDQKSANPALQTPESVGDELLIASLSAGATLVH